MRRSIPLLFLAFLLAAVTVADIAHAGKDKTVERYLRDQADALNRQLPMMVDQETRLDSGIDGPGLEFRYLYTQVNYTADQLNAGRLRASVEPLLTNAACTHPDMQRDLFAKGVTVSYIYRAKEGKQVLQVEITPETCRTVTSGKGKRASPAGYGATGRPATPPSGRDVYSRWATMRALADWAFSSMRSS